MNGNFGKLGMFGILLMMLLPLAQAGIQISSYTITPTTLKPGITGSVNLVLNNPSSSEFITAAYISATAAGIYFTPQTKIGDLGALGTTTIALPFRVSDTASPGTIPAIFEVTYTSNIQGGSNYKSFSVPLTVAATTLVKVTEVRISKDTIYPGDSFVIDAVIENSGGPIKNAILSYSSTSAYSFDGTTKIEVGNLDTGNRKSISIPVLAGNTITSANYIPFTLTYDDAVIAGNTETLNFGPVTAIQDYSKFALSAEAIDATPGGKGIFRIIIRNTGGNELKNFKITLPQTSTFFTPLDFTEKSLDSIKPGETKSLEFGVGINTNIVPQVYPLPLSITYQTRAGSETVTKAPGIKVGGAPDLTAYFSSNPVVITNDNKVYSVSIQVSNTGNSAVRALSVKASSDELDILTPADSFIGTLSLDDYSTVQYDAIVKKGIAPGRYAIDVELSYKDSYNEPHMEKKIVDFEIYPQEIAALAGKQNGGTPVMTIILVIAAIVILYFVYRRFFKSNMSQKLKLK